MTISSPLTSSATTERVVNQCVTRTNAAWRGATMRFSSDARRSTLHVVSAMGACYHLDVFPHENSTPEVFTRLHTVRGGRTRNYACFQCLNTGRLWQIPCVYRELKFHIHQKDRF